MAPGPASYGRLVTGYFRRHAFLPRYGREQRLSLRTADGVRLSGARLAGPPGAPATIVLVHGFVHSSRTRRIHAFGHLLARRVDVLVPELRGHGASGGMCTLGVKEPLDVAAAVAAADPRRPVVTVGLSLGGAAVLLHAGHHRGVTGVVAVSAPAWSGAWDTPSTERIRRAVSSRTGRLLLAGLLGTRLAPQCEPVPDSQAVVAAIAPAFTIIVHDPADHFFGEEHARTLYGWANEPKALWWLPGTGHGTDLLTPGFADRLLDEVVARVG